MWFWRLAVALVLAVVVGLPLARPLVDILGRGEAWAAWEDGQRLAGLGATTFFLLAGTLALALPTGLAAAVLLFRTDLPGQRTLRFLVVLGLFVPLPLLVSAWQGTLGSGGWFPVPFWENRPGQPWTTGLGPAIWLSGLASLPWVVVLVGQGLRWVESELEEDALLQAGPWRVLWHVTLPRCRAVLAAAAIWVALQTAGEITITDMLEVGSFAEEIFVQFSFSDQSLARAVALSLPAAGLFWLFLMWSVPRLERALPPLQDMTSPRLVFRLGRARWPCAILVGMVILLLAVIPLGSLVWKVGLRGWPPSWSVHQAWEQLRAAMHIHGVKVLLTLAGAVLAGLLATALALVSCWAARGSRLCLLALVSLAALAWALPGPVLGMGLKDVTIEAHGTILADLLYRGPSPVPIIWAHVLRFFPCAAALIWPALRMLPPALEESARLDGARPRQELFWVVLPLMFRAAAWSVLVVAALSLGDIAVSNRVETPGYFESFTHLLFDRMHNGVDNEVAGLCLVLLASVLASALVLAGARKLFRSFP